MAKVVLIDNYNREYVADTLLRENLSDNEARVEADSYNKKHRGSDTYAVVKQDTYKLWRGMSEII